MSCLLISFHALFFSSFLFADSYWYVGKYLKDAGFDVMGVANNHAGDFGYDGRASTQKVLTEQGIKFAGALDPPALAPAGLPELVERAAVSGQPLEARDVE